MRLLTFEDGDGRRIGARIGDRIVDLSRADASIPADMRRFFAAGEEALQAARAAVERGACTVEASGVRVVAPISDPEKIVCIGLNYVDHAVETGMPIPSEPVVFSKYVTAIVGPGEAVRIPASSRKVDYEVELVAVVGRGGRDIPDSDALKHVAGYTVGNDVSARDFQLGKPGGQWMIGKTFDTFAPIGPEIVTSDEIADPHALRIRCVVNGETVQDSCTDELVFGVEKLVAYLSGVFALSPGDLIFTGTPPGVGLGRDPQVWLQSGDVVVCEVEGIGRLENPVV